uniref:CBF1-interacting co-repressor CIR N-terminal domain-containing protein n=2 Tax=Rhizophora mucronata TaxID=61149 RepID=A0A2P2IPR3_RHIMU
MALKFLNKKGWHTGSLRNIENVWKAEQKHESEQKKLEELRKQIQDERERSEFRLLQQQAGLLPAQERLEFLYDSGLSVGKGSSSSKGGEGVEFKSTEEIFPTNNNSNVGNRAPAADVASSTKQSSVPGALFEDKPQSANDAWRKLHSDPLLMIRQREQEALARIKNNPVQMALIRKSAEKSKDKEKSHEKKEHRKKHNHGKSKHHKHMSSKQQSDSDDESYESQRRKDTHRSLRYREQYPSEFLEPKSVKDEDRDTVTKDRRKSNSDKRDANANIKEGETRKFYEERSHDYSAAAVSHDSYHKRRNVAPKLSEEERAARLREMQVDAELHEEQRWKRLKKAEADDAREANRPISSSGRNFLDAAKRSVYGAETGGSKTIDESVRRRKYYSQRSQSESNAFRR